MEVDLNVADAQSKALSTGISIQGVKPTDYVTTNNVINIGHNSPITETSAVDGVDCEFMSDSRRLTGHIQKYPCHIEQGISEKYLCHSRSNGWGDPKPNNTNKGGEPIRIFFSKNLSHVEN